MAFGHFFSIISSRWKIGLGSLASLGIPCLSCHRALPALLVKVFRTYFQFLYMSNAPPDAFGFSHPQNRSTYMYEDIYIYILLICLCFPMVQSLYNPRNPGLNLISPCTYPQWELLQSVMATSACKLTNIYVSISSLWTAR